MATTMAFQPLSPSGSCTSRTECSKMPRLLAFLMGLFLYSIPVCAQLQQPFVFTVDPANPLSIAVYTRNDLTGILTPVPGSPFRSRESVNVMTLDFKGRFLFTASFNPSKISMFTVDPNTGALQEVPNSPFASLSTNDPVFLSTDSSGQFLYVINFNGSQAGASSFEFFQIDSVNFDLIPSSSGATQLPGLFLKGATHPSGRSFYAFLSAPFSSIPDQAYFLLFDSSTGTFTIPDPNMGSSAGAFGCCLALDPQGKSLALGVTSLLTLYSLQADGTLAPNPTTGFVNGEALSMAFDTFGRFLYVGLPQTPANSASVRIISPVTLLETSNSPLPSSFPSPGTWIVDPTAPLLYADQVYQIDPQTGLPSAILPTNPLIQPAVFSQPPGSQPVVGPIALLSAASFLFGSLSVGQASSAQTLTVTSNGGQALSLNTLAITGANPGDFAETDTCHVPTVLQPGNACSVLVVFTPSASGNRSAAITITSNASPSMESAQLSGTGLAPASAVTLVPGSLDFGSVMQGSSASLNISVTNSGTAALHITTVVVGGANTGDYSSSSPTCNFAIAVNSACTIHDNRYVRASRPRLALRCRLDHRRRPRKPADHCRDRNGRRNRPGCHLLSCRALVPNDHPGNLWGSTNADRLKLGDHVSPHFIRRSRRSQPLGFQPCQQLHGTCCSHSQLYRFSGFQSPCRWPTDGQPNHYRRCAGFAPNNFSQRHCQSRLHARRCPQWFHHRYRIRGSDRTILATVDARSWL